jgi:hypothetical protein
VTGATRLSFLRTSGGVVSAAALARYEPWLARAATVGLRKPDSLPRP